MTQFTEADYKILIRKTPAPNTGLAFLVEKSPRISRGLKVFIGVFMSLILRLSFGRLSWLRLLRSRLSFFHFSVRVQPSRVR